MFVPIILGSDKTVVSIATGNNEYWPIYLSIGNIHNNTRRAHRNGVVLLGFHSIPKSKFFIYSLMSWALTSLITAEKKHAGSSKYRKFRRQLFHSALSIILSSLRPAMEHPEVVWCSDGHFRRAIYGIGPYIADYPEQCLLACIVQGWCPKYSHFISIYDCR
jgi:Plavaka transposase